MAEQYSAGDVLARLQLDISQYLQGLQQATQATQQFQQRMAQLTLPTLGAGGAGVGAPFVPGTTPQAPQQVQQYTTQVTALGQAFQRLAQGMPPVTAQLTQFNAQQQQYPQHAQGVTTLSQSYTTLASSLAGVGAAMLGLSSGTRVLEDLIQSGTRLETLRVGLTTFAGSAQASAEAFALVQQQSQRLGFDIVTLTGAYKDLLGSGRDTILSTQDLARIFVQVTDGVKAAGGSSEQAAGLVQTFASALNRGEITARQLHASMQGLPGLQGILARALHVTTDELRGQAGEHVLMASVTLPLLGNQIERELGGRADAAANTVQSAFTRLQSAFATLGNNLIAGPFGDFLKWIAAELEEDIKNIERVSQFVQRARETVSPPPPPGGEEGIKLRDIGARRQAAAEEVERLRAQEAGGPGGGIFPGTLPRQLREEAEANLRRLNAEYAAQQAVVENIVEQEQAAATAAADKAKAEQEATDATTRQQEALADTTRVQQQLNELAERYRHIQERAAEDIARDPAARERIIQQEIRDLEQLRRQIDDIQADAARRGAVPPAVQQQLQGRLNLSRQEQATIQRIGREQGVDPNFLAALRQTERGGPGREFGVLSVPAPTYEAQATIAAQTIRANQRRFEAQGGVAVSPEGRYTPEFIQFFSARYAPIGAANDPTGLNRAHARNLAQFYGLPVGAAPGGAAFAAPDIQTGIEQLKLLQDFIKNRQALIKQYLDAQTAIAQLTMTPEEFQATAVERAHLAVVQQRLLETQMARAPQATQTALQAALRALQEVVAATFAEFTLKEVRERVEREYESLLAGIRQRTEELRRALPRENLALQQPDLAAQLGIDVGAEGGRAVASQRAQAAAAQLQAITALPTRQQLVEARLSTLRQQGRTVTPEDEAEAQRMAEGQANQETALATLRQQLDVQDQLHGAEALQALQNQTRALQAQLSVRGESLDVQQREAIVQRELNRLRDEGETITPATEARVRNEAKGLVSLQHTLEDSRRPLQQFAETYESTFVKIQDTTLQALQKTESALVDFFSTGRFNAAQLFQGIVRDFNQLAVHTLITRPLAGIADQLFQGLRGDAPALGGLSAVTGGSFALAGGGLVTHPTLALIGEAGPELVLPVRAMQDGGLVEEDVATEAEASAAVESLRQRGVYEAALAGASRRQALRGLGGAAGAGAGGALGALLLAPPDLQKAQAIYAERFRAWTDQATGDVYVGSVDASKNITWASKVPGAVGYVAEPQEEGAGRQAGRALLSLVGSLAGAYAGSRLRRAQQGAVLRGPTMLLAGEAGAEAIIPLRHGGIPVSLDAAGRPVSRLPSGVTIPLLPMPRLADGGVIGSSALPATWSSTAMSPAPWRTPSPALHLTMNVNGVQDTQGFRATQSQIMRGAALAFQREWTRNL